MKYIPALDGVRALAILLVLVYHWFPEGQGINVMPNGPIGVTLFFVLSGYLISNILMEQQTLGTFLRSFKNFVARRALRIFPIYFLLLGLLWVLKHFSVVLNTDFYLHPGYYWSYLVNYWIETNRNWADALSPYWSLSVEEQFYLIWPFFILLLSMRFRVYFLWSTVLLGILYRYFSVHLGGGLGVSMLSCVDTFAWGALLAHYLRAGQSRTISLWTKRLIIPIGFCFLILCLNYTDADLEKQLFFRTCTSLVSVALLVGAMQDGVLARVFSFRPLCLIGQMSYGLYLYHMVVPDLFFQLAARLGVEVPQLPYQLVSISILALTAFLSYRFIELPIQSFKRYFQV